MSPTPSGSHETPCIREIGARNGDRLSHSPSMGWSKSTRIKVMLAIDLMFFLLELGVGFAVHSLALMADAFHMVRTPNRPGPRPGPVSLLGLPMLTPRAT